MSVTVYGRLRMFWGALDLSLAQSETPGYGPTQIVSGGNSAVIGSGVGVRRATLICDRSTAHPGADVATCHFDFLNMTSGAPDDTWITSDFSGLETIIQTWMTALVSYMNTGYKWTGITWHRVGTGIGKPNPAERVLTLTTPITGANTGHVAIPQAACSITFRTGVRRSWGRTYFPWGRTMTTTGTPGTADVDAVAGATNNLVTSAASNDMHLVVVSKPLNSSLNVEHVEVDDVIDVIRRRRWKSANYKKILP